MYRSKVELGYQIFHIYFVKNFTEFSRVNSL
jgi:hypothetical protein